MSRGGPPVAEVAAAFAADAVRAFGDATAYTTAKNVVAALVLVARGHKPQAVAMVLIGLTDVLGVGRAALSDSKWNGLAWEVYVFIAILFFVCCFSMARYSIYLEKKLHTGHKR